MKQIEERYRFVKENRVGCGRLCVCRRRRVRFKGEEGGMSGVR